MSHGWEPVVLQLDEFARRPDALGRSLLADLAEGTLPVLVLRGLLPQGAVGRNRERVSGLFQAATTTRYANGSLTTVGPYLAKYLPAPGAYFQDAATAQSMLRLAGYDLTVLTRQALAELFGLRSFEPAVEPDGSRYAEQNVRIYPVGNRTPLHNDNIMRDAAGTGLLLADLACHLSCVVCLQECDNGGELQVHRRVWEPAHEQFKSTGSLGYDDAVVADVPYHRYKPQTGDVYLLNPTYYHSIERVSGCDRVTMGFFFGFFDRARTDAVSWVLWSRHLR
jgi:hypothetical protein